MKKRILIFSGLLLVVAVAALIYINYWNIYRFFYYRSYARIQEEAPVKWEALLGADRETQARYWEEDMDYLLKKLEKEHYDLYHSTPSEEFEARADELKAELSALAPGEVLIGIRELVAAVGDGHTVVHSLENRRIYPFRLSRFAGGYYVTRAERSVKSILGLRLTAINGIPLEVVLARLSPMVSHDNPVDMESRALRFLPCPDYLRWYGLIDDPASALFSFVDAEGTGIEMVLPVVEEFADPLFLHDIHPAMKSLPLYRNGKNFYWYELMEEEKALYIQYDKCRSGDPPLKDFIDEVLAFIDEKGVEKVLVDLRYNGGGSSPLLDPLIGGLAAHSRIGRPGALYTAIGRNTYSSAVLNALDLDRRAGAVLIGEKTGGAASHYGEVRILALPRSGVIIQYSTKYFDRSEYPEGPIQPEIPVEYEFEDYIEGTDPVIIRFLEDRPPA